MDRKLQELLFLFQRLDDAGKDLVFGFLTGYLTRMNRGDRAADGLQGPRLAWAGTGLTT